jgi:predicted nucleic acid-binding protein
VIVLDASAAVDFLLEHGERGEWVGRQLARATEVAAPHLIDLEVASAVRRRELAGEMRAARGRIALLDLAAMPLRRYPATALLERVWQLRGALTAYDAAYVALAEALRAPLVSTDAHLARTTGHRAVIATFSG